MSMIPSNLTRFQCNGVAEQLEKWREQWQIADVQAHCRSPAHGTYSSTVIATAGCLSLIAQTRAGLLPVNGFELDVDEDTRAMRQMCRSLTQVEPYGDFRRTQPKSIRRTKIVSTGLPCPDYSPAGSGMGSRGMKGGDCWVDQGRWLVAYDADICIIEQSFNARTLNNGEGEGADFKKLVSTLSQRYVVYDMDVRTWRHGDVSNRTRLYIVAINKRHGDKAGHWQWPDYKYDRNYYPIAADVVVPDHEVGAEYILQGTPRSTYPWVEPIPGKMHKVADFGDGMGNSYAPHPVHSMLSLPHTQLTTNGGGRLTMLSWTPGEPIEQQRLPTITCTSNMASLPSSYVPWATQFGDGSDRFLRKCINMGEPLQTCTAIHKRAVEFLEYLGVEKDVLSPVQRATQQREHMGLKDLNKELHSMQIWRQMYVGIRSMMVDTGASGSLNKTSLEPYMSNAAPSKFTISTAKAGAKMAGSKDGDVEILVLNTAGHGGYKQYTPHSFNTTTSKELKTELYSMDCPFRHGGWNLKIRQPDHENGVCEICRDAKHGRPAQSIPIRYDYEGAGGWWIDYVPVRPGMKPSQYMKTSQFLQWHQSRKTENTSSERVAMLTRHTYDADSAEEEFNRVLKMKYNDIQSVKIAHYCRCDEEESPTTCRLCCAGEELEAYANEKEISDVLETRCLDEKEIRGYKEQLKFGKSKWTNARLHKHLGHSGNCDNCWICKAAKGAMKRYTRKVDPHRETKPWHVMHMDAVTFSDRSIEGNKYMITFKDEASGDLKLRSMYLKSDAPRIIRDFIESMRADPDYQPKDGREIIKYVVTDEPGEWGLKSKQWAQAKKELRIQSRHATPETSKEMGRAENANKIAEQTIMAMLLEANLPPDHWEVCMRFAEFVLARLPNLASDVNESIDGDRASPIEIATQGRHSRRQVLRELSYYIPPGTVALVHEPKVKGSQLKEKVRYGIAWGMYREQVVFRCPIVASTFRSKSYMALEMAEGLNCYQFLGLPAKMTTRRKLRVKGDEKAKVDIQLPKAKKPLMLPQLPVVSLQAAGEAGVLQQEIERSERTKARSDSATTHELGGSVKVYDSDGKELKLDKEKGQVLRETPTDNGNGRKGNTYKHKIDRIRMQCSEHEQT